MPAAIYTIPPSCPIYYTTFVRIYDARPDHICYGYTPGYLGCCVRDGCVVWGTGYRHQPWCGHQWFGRPCTYGFSAGVRWTVGSGFSIGLAIGARPPCRPWWGPLASPHSAFYPARVAGADVHLNMGNANIYAAWGGTSVRPHHALEGTVRVQGRVAVGSPRANDVFAAPDGHVYRHTATGGWEAREAGKWQPARTPTGATERAHAQQLEADRQARERGATRSENVHRAPTANTAHYQPMQPQEHAAPREAARAPERAPERAPARPAPEPRAPAPRPQPRPAPIPPGLRGGSVRHTNGH